MLVAPSAFKGSFSARAAARILAAALPPGTAPHLLPVADGGDGTAAVLGRALAGRVVRVAARDALGQERRPPVWLLPQGGGAVDLAAVCGLRRLIAGRMPLRPLDAGTFGLGEALRHLHALAPDGTLLLGLGGSASSDGGAGLLQALGGRLLDRRGRPIPSGARGLERLARIDLDAVPAALSSRLLALVDVSAPLLGAAGSARLFGPQKGADGPTVERLEAALDRLRHGAERDLGVDPALAARAGSGSAGGVGYALALLGVPLVPGADSVLDRLAFDRYAAASGRVLVGEGALDRTSLVGKAPVRAALRARAAGARVALVCARADADAKATLHRAGIVVVAALPDNGQGRADVGALRTASRTAFEALA